MTGTFLDPNPAAQKRKAVETRDFSAVVFVGTGENLYPFNQGTNVLPKALMPVGNVPIISYVLDWVFAAGLTDILIIIPPSTKTPISDYLQQTYSPASHPRARITLKTYADGETVDEDEDGSPSSNGNKLGTARLLKRFRSFIKSDFVLLPCDVFFPAGLTLASILDRHRATPDAVLTSVLYEPTEAVKESEEKMLVATDKETNELLLVQSLDGLESDLEVRTELLFAHPTLSMSTRLQDAHVYVFRRTVLDLLATRRSKDLSSVKEQLVPWLIKGAWQQGLGHSWARLLCPPQADPLASALARSTATPHFSPLYSSSPSLEENDKRNTGAETPYAATPYAATPVNPRTTTGEQLALFKAALGAKGMYQPKKREREKPKPIPWTCRVIIAKAAPAAAEPAPKSGKGGGRGGAIGKAAAPLDSGAEHLIRANSLAGYWDISRRIIKTVGGANAAAAAAAGAVPGSRGGSPGAGATDSEGIAPSAQISPDSLTPDDGSLKVGEKTSIKKSIIGRHCHIGKGVKLTNCILWDWVHIGDYAKLEGVVIANNGRIGDRVQAKDCEFGSGFEAKAGAVLRGERLIAGQE